MKKLFFEDLELLLQMQNHWFQPHFFPNKIIFIVFSSLMKNWWFYSLNKPLTPTSYLNGSLPKNAFIPIIIWIKVKQKKEPSPRPENLRQLKFWKSQFQIFLNVSVLYTIHLKNVNNCIKEGGNPDTNVFTA